MTQKEGDLVMKYTASLISTTALLFITACGQPSTTSLMEKGDFARWQGRWNDAAANYSEITQRHPGDWRAHYHLGQCLLELGNPQAASASLEIANAVAPENVEVCDLLAESFLASGNENKLFTFLEQLAKERQTVRAWTRFAEYSMAMSDPDTATLAINTAIAIDEGTTTKPYIVAAGFAEQLGNDDLALQRWKEAWIIDPNNTQVAQAIRGHGEVPGPTMTGAVQD
ncbi:MAG: tetratricopeptide repeat protein [Phycisphaerales bacterium]|nr:tetratricopeptide repeat protein [Phycisphaerales bacterium]MDP6692830.1 tetratricopeptide repeat protein [Phycisphaerales bacterium]